MNYSRTQQTRLHDIARRRGGELPGDDRIPSSWVRCLDRYGLEPGRFDGERVIEQNQVRERQDALGRAASVAGDEMKRLYRRIASSGYVILMTDHTGVIVSRVCDPAFDKFYAGTGLWVGTDWSEQAHGTNGIGTCISDGRSLTVHQSDHFFDKDTNLSCSGAPIHDPEGRLIAVLDASAARRSGTREAQSHVLALVEMSARYIENACFLHSFADRPVLRLRRSPEFLCAGLSEGMVALDDNGRILAVNEGSLRMLGEDSRDKLVGRPVGDVFDRSFEDLLRSGQSHGGLSEAGSLRARHGDQDLYALLFRLRSGARRSAGALADTPADRVPAPCSMQRLDLPAIAGGDRRLQAELRRVERLVDRRVPFLLQGETGAGKEVLARAIHHLSARAVRPFVAINCSAIPETLIESELFGYQAGAFTGARRGGMKGKIEQANGGTLFLDEIGDMPLALQTRLLRVLEEGQLIPLGSEVPVDVDICVISATHRDLPGMVAEQRFREDLYFRLNGFKVDIPALREREDIGELIDAVLRREADGEAVRLSEPARRALLDYHWPGNIRQLRNVLRTAVGLCEGEVIEVADLPSEILGAAAGDKAELTAPEPADAINPLVEAERQALVDALTQQGWNISGTAASLGMSRSTLYRKMEKHGIRAPGAASVSA